MLSIAIVTVAMNPPSMKAANIHSQQSISWSRMEKTDRQPERQ
jgi:hypothetical protein